VNALTTTWRQLVRLRLWPVAVLLVAALAAVPLLLSRDAEPVVQPQASATGAETSAKASDALAEPVVAEAATEDRSRRRRVLGSRKDPFQPAPVKKTKKKPTKTQTEDKTDVVTNQPVTSGPSAPTAPSTPVAVTPVKPKKVYEKGSLIVRFGDAASGDLKRINLKKLAGLPDGDEAESEPLLVYLGLTKSGKKARFLVDASLDATGDGSCKPHPSTCETIELGKGETEFFDLVDPETGEISAQYELDLVDIK
jgi:hypothetical protein